MRQLEKSMEPVETEVPKHKKKSNKKPYAIKYHYHSSWCNYDGEHVFGYYTRLKDAEKAFPMALRDIERYSVDGVSNCSDFRIEYKGQRI